MKRFLAVTIGIIESLVDQNWILYLMTNISRPQENILTFTFGIKQSD